LFAVSSTKRRLVGKKALVIRYMENAPRVQLVK
jgi:hypothetical protein